MVGKKNSIYLRDKSTCSVGRRGRINKVWLFGWSCFCGLFVFRDWRDDQCCIVWTFLQWDYCLTSCWLQLTVLTNFVPTDPWPVLTKSFVFYKCSFWIIFKLFSAHFACKHTSTEDKKLTFGSDCGTVLMIFGQQINLI